MEERRGQVVLECPARQVSLACRGSLGRGDGGRLHDAVNTDTDNR